MQLNAITVVWGPEYTRFFLDAVVPSLLWPGNLPAIAENHRPAYLLYTTLEDAQVMDAHPAFARLKTVAEVQIHSIEENIADPAKKYEVAASCHKDALSRVAAEGAALLLLSPDCVYSDGALAHAFGHLRRGKRAVLSASLRAAKEGFEPALAALCGMGGVRPADPRALFALAMDHLHPLSRTLLVDSQEFSTWPSHVYWPVGDEGAEGILAHCFHLHPLMVRPREFYRDFRDAMDNDFLAQACPDPAEMHLIDDSDDALGVEVSAQAQFDHLIRPCRFHPANVAEWSHLFANAQHREFFRVPVRFRASAPTSAWAEAEARAAADVGATLKAAGD